ncbi:MAG: SH3 domain-containing protein, partial [Candidatus Omnitrophica bacterium]|nr:SH3 domain-containing protein [Candidatus Omnitrophota bacterium]
MRKTVYRTIRPLKSCLPALALLGLMLHTSSGWATAKVFLLSGETRVGAVLARDGRITVTMTDRLFQHPEESVHRIDHVTGETTLVAGDNVYIRETPEPFATNLAAIPKGCEVRILGYQGDWTEVEVYSGHDLAKGFI